MKAQQNDSKNTGVPGSRVIEATTSGHVARRKVLRGAAVALPTILTLHSGAALARTSNLISRADGAPVDAAGNNLCLNEQSAVEVFDGGQRYDLGEPPNPEVTQIPTTDGRQFFADEALTQPVTNQEMCDRGGTFFFEGNGTQPTDLGAQARADMIRQSFLPPEAQGVEKQAQGVEVPRGGLVSATALASFAGRVMFRTI